MNWERRLFMRCSGRPRKIRGVPLGSELWMGDIKDVMGPLISRHTEAAYLFGLIEALENNTLDDRIERISALLRPPAAPSGDVGVFL